MERPTNGSSNVADRGNLQCQKGFVERRIEGNEEVLQTLVSRGELCGWGNFTGRTKNPVMTSKFTDLLRNQINRS